MIVLSKIVDQWRGVREALQSGVEETSIAEIGQADSYSSTRSPFRGYAIGIAQDTTWYRQTILGMVDGNSLARLTA